MGVSEFPFHLDWRTLRIMPSRGELCDPKFKQDGMLRPWAVMASVCVLSLIECAIACSIPVECNVQ